MNMHIYAQICRNICINMLKYAFDMQKNGEICKKYALNMQLYAISYAYICINMHIYAFYMQ